MIQMRKLEFVPEGDIELDNILLLIAQTGVYIYTSFTIIGGNFTLEVKISNYILIIYYDFMQYFVAYILCHVK